MRGDYTPEDLSGLADYSDHDPCAGGSNPGCIVGLVKLGFLVLAVILILMMLGIA